MRSNRKRHVVVAGVVALSLLGAGAAVAAIGSGPSSPARHAFHQGGMNHGGMAGGVVMDAAAEYIGVSETALRSERHDGKSLAQIAVEHGKTAAGLEQTLVAAFKANSNTAVAAGRITADQAAQAVVTFQSRVQTMIYRTATGPMEGRGEGMGMGQGAGMGLGMGGGGR
jgi:hypothetical protein